MKDYYKKNKNKIIIQHKKYKKDNRKKINSDRRIYYKNNSEYILNLECTKKAKLNYNKRQRLKALKRVGRDKIECIRCGCSDYRFLEINHKYGGGAKEYKQFGTHGVIQSINRKNRTIRDLEILCKPCNGIHALELKYSINIPLKVIFQGGNR